jgi:hypothetical protein
MQLPPAGRHLDQKATVPQEVVHLTVGVAAGKGPEGPALRRITACGQDDAHHGDLLQVFPGMAGAAREVGGHRSGDVLMLQRQGIGGGMGMVAAMGPAPASPRYAGRAPGAGALVLPGAGPMAGGLGDFGAGVWHESTLSFKSVPQHQAEGNWLRRICGRLESWKREYGAISAVNH